METKIDLAPSRDALMRRALKPVAMTPEVGALLARDGVVVCGASGGKDSQAVALAVASHLDAIGHKGPRILVHADLGRVEWKDSIRTCEEMAAHLGMELLVVRRNAGDMMDRWLGRWKANVERYRNLSCVKVILPWSTPQMRFCTSELKNSVIFAALKKRYPDQDIVSVTGIRREESAQRRKAAISKEETKLKRKRCTGVSWNAIIEWELADVLASIAQAGLRLHEAYTKYKASRVSCAYCIMSAEADLRAAAGCEDNHAIYVEMVELEAASSFAFQGNRWLADAAPHLLSPELLERVAKAKAKAVRRQEIESRIPEHLLYSKGWPTRMPTRDEAVLLANVRAEVAQLLGIPVKYTTPDEVLARYAALMAEGAIKAAKKAPGAKKARGKAAKVSGDGLDPGALNAAMDAIPEVN